MIYLWVKSLHIISMVAWFAGLFYLPRLFVYHAQTDDKVSMDRFNIMQHKLLTVIMLPASIVTVLTGLCMIYLVPLWLKMPWMHIKLTSVGCLLIYHCLCYIHHKKFVAMQNKKSHVYFRMFNEIPTVFLLIIVIMVVVKPLGQ